MFIINNNQQLFIKIWADFNDSGILLVKKLLDFVLLIFLSFDSLLACSLRCQHEILTKLLYACRKPSTSQPRKSPIKRRHRHHQLRLTRSSAEEDNVAPAVSQARSVLCCSISVQVCVMQQYLRLCLCYVAISQSRSVLLTVFYKMGDLRHQHFRYLQLQNMAQMEFI